MATDLTPGQISAASFQTVRKGYDPSEVDAFLVEAAHSLERALQQGAAMEARARAAIARLQELTASSSGAPEAESAAAEAPSEPTPSRGLRVSPDQAETISRTLLLAQRTADTTIAEAQSEAQRIRHEAQAEAESTIDSTRELSARLLDEARSEARKASESERREAANEVQSLKARREFLVGDVDQLEQFLVDQRERLRGAARQIEALCERVPAGLGVVHPPVLSASDDEPTEALERHDRPADSSQGDGHLFPIDDAADHADDGSVGDVIDDGADDDGADDDGADDDGADGATGSADVTEAAAGDQQARPELLGHDETPILMLELVADFDDDEDTGELPTAGSASD